MKESRPVVIVSAFGRGHALAQELTSQDIPVTLLDVGACLGESTAEDEEGPFGFFNQGLSNFDNQFLLEGTPPQLQNQGFTWMFSRGPLEMRGPVTTLHRESFGVPEQIWKWVYGEASAVKDNQYLLNGDFRETWFYHLSRSFHSNHWLPNYRAGLVEGSLAYGSDFMVRSVFRAGVQKSLDQLSAAGVDVRSPVEIVDLAREGSSLIKSFEIRKVGIDSTELLSFETGIWFLSTEETEKLSIKVQEKLFTHGVLRAKGSWIRTRLKIPATPQREALPIHSVWVQDTDLPWTHENLFTLVRTPNADLFDLWFRLPEAFRFQKDYVQAQINDLMATLERRLGIEGVLVSEYPASTQRTSDEVGPSRFPLFDEREWNEFAFPKWRNFYWVAPETTDGLGWNFLFNKTKKVAEDVKLWWRQREDERIKREERAAEKAARENRAES